MLQKDALRQDMFLLGAPGSRRRQLAMQYLELTQRELEYIALSRDTTESDLKQRREIEKKAALYYDQVRRNNCLSKFCPKLSQSIPCAVVVCCEGCSAWPCPHLGWR